MVEKNPKVDEFINNAQQWQEEYRLLRKIVLDCQLTEDVKWGVPCYTYQKSNVVIIHGFKEYCGLLFVKGSLIKDGRGILIQQTENVQAARQARFTNAAEIVEVEPVLKVLIYEAIEIEKAGLKVDFKRTTEFPMPDEFKKVLEESAALKTAFEALTPGRQRAYLLIFPTPNRPKLARQELRNLSRRF